LTAGGTIAAWSVGVAVLFGTGWAGGAVLAAFFVPSNLISRLLPPRGPSDLDIKSDRRDLWQVYANGGPAALGALVGTTEPTLGMWLLTASLAAAAADTWATSLGNRSDAPPRMLGVGRVVAAGTSGGMSTLGSAGAAAGALIVGAAGAITAGMPILLPLGTLVGFVGMVADSTLGALLQGRFYCPACGTASEWKLHRCGTATVREGGMAWLNNDGVNFLATAGAAGLAWITWLWLAPPA
jgi:uncharacterized protein (TIGR00297 family)